MKLADVVIKKLYTKKNFSKVFFCNYNRFFRKNYQSWHFEINFPMKAKKKKAKKKLIMREKYLIM